MESGSRSTFLPSLFLALLSLSALILPPAASFAASSSETGKAEYRSTPLLSRAADAETGFKLLETAATGIDFKTFWEPKNDALMRGIGATASAAGVAIGDYDGDGRPDLFLTRPFGGNRLYRNLGDFRFEDVTAAAGMQVELEYDAWGAGPCFVDIDDDGDLDLYVCSHRRANRFYINQGDGTFVDRAKELGLNHIGASITMAFSDYDLDGDLDAYLVTNWLVRFQPTREDTYAEMRAGRMRVAEEFQELFDVLKLPSGQLKVVRGAELDHFYRNEGGKFVDVTEQVLGEHSAAENWFGHAARWFDYDRDGYPDLYISNDFYGADQLFHNNGDGTLTDVTKSALSHIPWYSMGSDAADINNDGLLDLMAADMAFTTHFKSKVNMGDMSYTAWFLDSSDPKQQMSNALYINSGTGRFLEGAALAGVSNTDWTWALKFADFDNDGLQDLYVTNGMTRNWFDSDVRQRSHSTFEDMEVEFNEKWESIWKNEPPLREKNIAFRNRGDLQFDKVGQEWGLDSETVSFGSALGDLDGDGDLDIVTVNFDDQVHVYRNEGGKNHRVVIELQGKQSNRQGLGALVEIETAQGLQVRDLTSVRGFVSADEPKLFFGLGEADTIDRLTVHWPSGTVQTLTNLPADQAYVISEASGSEAEPAVKSKEPLFTANADLPPVEHFEEDYNDFAEQPLLPNRLSKFGPGIACGDVNGDGRDDYYMTGGKGMLGQLLIGEPGGFDFDYRSDGAWRKNRQSEEMGAIFFDADGDGDLDLYVVNGSNEDELGSERYRDRLYLNDGSGKFASAAEDALPDLRESGSCVVAADFDRDGDLDLFVGGRTVPGSYPDTPVSTLLRNEGGRFSDATEEVAPGLKQVGMVTGALWSDTDGDGWVDLLVTCEWGPVSLWHNNQGQLADQTGDAGLAEHTGWWNGIAGGDLDHDGDIDYVVTNFGLNNKYHASLEHPAVLYYGDMDENGHKDLIEAKFSGDALLPVRGRSCSTNAMPMLGEKCKTYREFASLTLPDLYGGDKLQSSSRLEATTLESGMLINDGSGRFEFRPLPRLAQVSPGFAAVVLDANGDGFNDIYIVQNFYNPQRETVRMDGGVSQLLLGDGSGEFQPASPAESGLLVPGDGKALCVTDLNDDSRPDFLITQNSGPLLAFENQSRRSAKAAVEIELAGPAGNPTGVGSLVTLVAFEGVKSVAEQSCGNGYLSQSTAKLYLTLPEGEAKAVKVRWPDGSETEVQVTPGQDQLKIEYSSAG